MDEEVKDRVTPMDLDKLTTIYIKIRDRRADNKRMFEAEDNDLKEQMEVLEVNAVPAALIWLPTCADQYSMVGAF